MDHQITLNLSLGQAAAASLGFLAALITTFSQSQANLGLQVGIIFAVLYSVLKMQEGPSAIRQEIQDQGRWLSDVVRGILNKTVNMERRLMLLEFSPFECCRQITAAVDSWDEARDPNYASRQVFQELGRYSRNQGSLRYEQIRSRESQSVPERSTTL